ncbi:two-partner secretion domain-containing protein [Humidesulfovibrio idahonensis]
MNATLKHALINLLVVLLVLEPFSFAAAGGIVVAPGAPASKQPTMDAAPNGVPVVNIVKPSASGISHNLFDAFNVSPKGVIINNSNRPGVSQLGGAITGNANFGGGPEARLILNEVTGSSRSNIEGYTEIFGYAAQYILANPNGVSVNGGGFINTPKATLTTGVPRLDGSGALLGLDVRRGDVLIDGQGINADNLDAFEIVTRSAKINAEIHAKQLNIIGGQGSYNPATGQTTPLAPDGSVAPTVFLDSTALGGMYAQRIRFVGTEAGVGVNLAGPVRATDQLTLTADGKIKIVGAVSADKDASVASKSDGVDIAGKLGAGGAMRVEAAQDLSLTAQPGGDAPLIYGATVNVSAQKLTNTGGKMLAESALTAATAGDLSNTGTIYAGSDASLIAKGALSNSGQIQAKGALTAEGQGVGNTGTIYAGSDASLTATGALNNSGQILAKGALTAEGLGVENSGTLQAEGVLTARSGAGFTNTGTVTTQKGLSVTATGMLDNSGTLYTEDSAAFQAASLYNRAGGQIVAKGDALFGVDAELSNSGSINAGRQATLRTKGSLRNETAGQVLAQTSILLESLTDFYNLGAFKSGGTGSYSVTGQFHNSGTLSHSGSASLTVPSLVNDATGQILFGGDSQVNVSGDLTNAGLLFSGGKATYRVGGTLLNNRGQLLSQGDMVLEGAAAGQRMLTLQNDSGSIESLQGGVGIKAGSVLNNNLDFSLVEGAIAGASLEGGMHSYGNDAWGVGSIFNAATGHGTTALFKWDAKRIYPAYVTALGLSSTRNVFSLAELTAAVSKAEQEMLTTPDATRKTNVDWVKNNIIAAQAPYAVLIPGGRGEIAVYEAKTTTDQVAGADKGASIAASTSISVDADQIKNNISKISTASGDITFNAGAFENVGKEVYERSTVNWGRGFTNNSKHKGVYTEGTGQELVLTPVSYAYGTINAGSKVAITAAHVSNGITENSGAAGTASAMGIVAPVKPSSLGQSLPSMTDLIGTQLKNGLFSANTTPGHHYLMETNPALTNMSTLYGSDYFLKRSGIDLDKTHRQLLGDAFYETNLVREQIFALTGKRLLSSSATSDAEQMQALMDSALSAKESLDLTVGVALSNDQIAKLTKDIVWLEKATVDGHEVLVPKVYLASKSLTNIAQGGSVIVGKDVAITTTGDTKSSGVLLAENTLTINAANIFNTSGTIKGQTVALAATDSITNTSGSISGGDVSLSAGKNITVNTATTTFTSSTTTSEVAEARGKVAATGALTMTAGENIAVTGADVAAGGDAKLTAGKTVAIAAQTLSNKSSSSGAHNYRGSSAIEANSGSTVTAGGALAVSAGEDALVTGSKLQAGGDVALAAGRNLSIASATDKQESSSFISGKSGGLFGGKSSESYSGSSTTNVASQVVAGGKLTAEAGKAGTGDLVVAGSKLSASTSVSLTSEGNIQIAAAQMTSSSHSESKSSGAMGLLSDSALKDNQKVTTVRSEVEAGTDIAVEAKQDITLTAAKVTSGGETKLTSVEGQVSILTSKDSEYNRSVSSNVGLLTWSSQDKGKNAETVVNTLIQTGKGLTITSRNGVTVEYKQTGDLRQDIQQLSQAQGLEWMGELLKRDDVNWKAVQEKYETWNKKNGGLSPAATIVLAIAASAATAAWASGFAGSLVESIGNVGLRLALQSAIAAGITATASNVAVATANTAAGGDFGKNMEALASEQGVRSLLASMVLASAMSNFNTALDGKELLEKTKRALVTSVVKTLTSNVVGGKDLEKSFLTALGSSFDSYVMGEVGSENSLERTERVVLAGALGAAGAKLTGGDPYQAALSAMTVEAADWVQAKELTPAQKAQKEKYSAFGDCSYKETCKSVEVAGEKYVKIEPGTPTETTQDQTTTAAPMTQEEAKQADIIKKASAQLAEAGVTQDMLFNGDTNLKISIYYKEAATGKGMGEVVVAVKGTDPLSGKDWLTNIKQAFGFGGTQYDVTTNEKALIGLQNFANSNNCMLTATGHSLGGGVAMALASTGYFDEAIVFNPASVNANTIERAKGNAQNANDKTTAYVSRADLLNAFQTMFLNPLTGDKVYGTVIVTEGAGFHGIDPFMTSKNKK